MPVLSSSAPAIAFDAVTKTYGAVRAVDTVSVAIPAGTFVALVGTSGSGKSTLLKTINRLIDPDSGTVTIDGTAVTDGEPALLRRRIGYVFQNVGLFPHMTVGDNVAIGPRVASQPISRDRVHELLTLVELPIELSNRRPDELSGGQRQRVGVARALATGARLLLMDEPFGALDPVTRDTLARTVRALHDRLDLTTVMVTHDMAEALLLADRIIVMSVGRIVADATPKQLIAGAGGAAAQALVAVPRAHAMALAALT